MKIQDAYTDWSVTYDQDRNLTRDLDQSVTQAALAELRCETILEIGCGTGKNTALLAAIGKQVLALDFSRGMIEKAKAKQALDNVGFAVADLTEPWPCPDGSIDLIVCNLVLEHISELSPVFAESSRVLVKAGRLFISELHPFRQYQGTQARFQRDDQTILIPAFVHHLTDFLDAARENGLALISLKESWYSEDQNKPPRLISFMFEKQ